MTQEHRSTNNSAKRKSTLRGTCVELTSPRVQRSAVSGKLVFVSERDQALRKQRAQELNLGWYV